MRAVKAGKKKPVLIDVPEPKRAKGEALIRVDLAGICATDLEILRGYMEFQGVLGHEFVGTVLEADDSSLSGKRVVGGINCGCGGCQLCLESDPRHCPDRSVLGILSRDGAFAEKITLPEVNLVPVPDSVTDETAVFAEPVAAALEITEQIAIGKGDEILVLGDGRMGTLISLVLREAGARVTVRGKMPEKLARLAGMGFEILPEASKGRFTTVVDATGSAEAINEAIARTLPRGRIILKTTTHDSSILDVSRIVIDEITITGSRCGPVDRAVELLATGVIDVKPLITGIYRLQDAEEAFRVASLPGSLKVLIAP